MHWRDLPRDVDEVVNYVGAMNYGLARLAELPVSVRLIREIHERLLQGVRGAADARRAAPHAELDRPGRLHPQRSHFRAAAAARGARGAGRAGNLPAR